MSDHTHSTYLPFSKTEIFDNKENDEQLLRLHAYCLLPLEESLPTLMEKVLADYDRDTLTLVLNILDFYGYQVCPHCCRQKMSYLVLADRKTRQKLLLKCVQVSWQYIQTFENYKTLPVLAERLLGYLVAGARDEEFHNFMNAVSKAQTQYCSEEQKLSVEREIRSR